MKRAFYLFVIHPGYLLINVVAYEIRQGTIEQKEAEREWVLAHYSRTAKKRSLLSIPSARPTTSSHEEDSEPPSKKRTRR